MSFFPPPHPYPADRSTTTTGEASAWVRPAGAPHDLESANGSADYLVTGAVSRGDYGLYRWNMGAEPAGPGPHFHRSVSESFFVLDGTIRLYDGTRWIDGRAGDFLFVPEGGLHGFRNESGEPASMLIVFSPGAPREPYFEGLADIGRTGTVPTDEEMAEFYRLHDTFWA